MKTLVNKNNPQIRITAPEIKVNIDTQTFYIGDEMFDMEDWTLVEEEPSIVKTIKEFVEKGKRCEQQAVEDNDQENYVFWGGFRNCAENILREVEEPTEDDVWIDSKEACRVLGWKSISTTMLRKAGIRYQQPLGKHHKITAHKGDIENYIANRR